MNRIRVSGLKAGLVIGTTIALLGIGVGVTMASIPASGGTINACYSTATGALRVIDYPSHHCGSGERLLRWNQTTVAGAVPLLAMQGTACSSIGAAGKLTLGVDPGTGQVTFTCKTQLTVKGGVMLAKIDILAGPSGPPAQECLNAMSCSVSLPYGLTDAQVNISAATAFTYTCPGGIFPESAYTDVTRTIYLASCTGISTNTDQTVLVAARPS